MSIYSWTSDQGDKYGYLRFFKVEGKLYIVSIDINRTSNAFDAYASEVDFINGSYHWSFGGVLAPLMTQATLGSDKILVGSSEMEGKGEYGWTATEVTKNEQSSEEGYKALAGLDREWLSHHLRLQKLSIPSGLVPTPLEFKSIKELK